MLKPIFNLFGALFIITVALIWSSAGYTATITLRKDFFGNYRGTISGLNNDYHKKIENLGDRFDEAQRLIQERKNEISKILRETANEFFTNPREKAIIYNASLQILQPAPESEEDIKARQIEQANIDKIKNAPSSSSSSNRGSNLGTALGGLASSMFELAYRNAKIKKIKLDALVQERVRLENRETKFIEEILDNIVVELDLLDRQQSQLQQQIQSQAHFSAIAKVHPDYDTIPGDIKFLKYINSLQSHQYQEAMRIIESGTAEEVIELLSNYKIKIKEDTIRFNKIAKAHPDYERIVSGVNFMGLSSRQRQKVEHLIESGTAEEVIEQLSCYKDELSAIELVQNSLYNKVIDQKINKLIEENKIKGIDGWRASKIKDNNFSVAYTWEEENMPEEIGFFFEVNISKNTVQLIEEQ